jgi:signal transduction histidine kinase
MPVFTLRDRPPARHDGLEDMRERAERRGGWWKARNDPLGGTVVEFWLPREPQGDSPAA